MSRLTTSHPVHLARSALLFGCFALAIGGCKTGETLYPVSGKVTVGDTPLNAGAITFAPDTAKGNTAKSMATGQIKSGGEYSLTTEGKTGAPLGWYKVTIMTNTPGGEKSTIQVNPKYTNPTTTNLAVEVVASPSPGKYDFKLTK